MSGTVRHFAIHTDDTDRAMAFYGAVFGWTFEAWGPPGFYLIVGALAATELNHYANTAMRMDSMSERIDRIERRLELQEG